MRKKPLENFVGQAENACCQHFLLFPQFFPTPFKLNFIFSFTFILLTACSLNLDQCIILLFGKEFFNPLPHMPILASSNSATNKDMMSETWTNENTII